jgi:DNA-binding transcriptional MerR regulator
VSTRETEHLSIGEVLAELTDEFPDITISKIRFLESQGLVNPERTPSGYRKFYPSDLARLRWILFQQKEHFLPLKVIKERLDEIPPGAEAQLFESVHDDAVPAPEQPLDAPERPPESPMTPSAPVAAAASTSRPSSRPAARVARRAPAFAPTLPADDAPDPSVTAPSGADGGRHSRQELAAAAGLDDSQVDQLESFGLLGPVREVDGVAEYDDEAVEVAQISAGFLARGVEARHLRMYRTFAEREAVLFGQLLMPYVRQRNPEARARLQEELGELASLGRKLRTALLRDAVRETLAE